MHSPKHSLVLKIFKVITCLAEFHSVNIERYFKINANVLYLFQIENVRKIYWSYNAYFFLINSQNSLTRSAPLANDSQARSGARFHTSYDKRYIIKTITSEDVAEMHNILKKYHQVICYFLPECSLFQFQACNCFILGSFGDLCV